jgi:hypothetical protein
MAAFGRHPAALVEQLNHWYPRFSTSIQWKIRYTIGIVKLKEKDEAGGAYGK